MSWSKDEIISWLTEYVDETAAKKFKSKCEYANVGLVKARAEFFDQYPEEKRVELEGK